MLDQQAVAYQIVGTRQQQLRMERLGDIIVRPTVQSLQILFGRIECRQQNDRDMAEIQVVFHLQAHFRTCHFRHHDIADHQIGLLGINLFQPFLAVMRTDHFVERGEQVFQHLKQLFVVLHQKHRARLVGHTFLDGRSFRPVTAVSRQVLRIFYDGRLGFSV